MKNEGASSNDGSDDTRGAWRMTAALHQGIDTLLLALASGLILGVAVLHALYFEPLSPTVAVLVGGVLTITAAVFADFQLDRRKRGNRFHVTAVLSKDTSGITTGLIRWATNWKGAGRVKVEPRETPENEWHRLDAAQAATIRNVLPRLEEMQHATRGLLHISGKDPAWTFVCIRDWVVDTFTILLGIVTASVIVGCLIVATGNYPPPASYFPPIVYFATSIVLSMMMFGLAIGPWHRRNLSSKLFLTVKVQPNYIAEIEWTEDLGLGPSFSPQRHHITLSNAQGLARFCDLIKAMQSTIKMEWNHVELEFDRPADLDAPSGVTFAAAETHDWLSTVSPGQSDTPASG